MDDRDKHLTDLFVRNLDDIPLPPRATWRRALRKETMMMRSFHSLLTAGTVVAVLTLAWIFGSQINQRQQSAVAPTSAISGLAVVLSDRFGFVLTTPGVSFDIVSETGSTVAPGIGGEGPVVSPSGDRLAYLQSSDGTTRVLLRNIADGTDRIILTLLARPVTPLVWSNDGTGLLLALGVGADAGLAPTTPATLQTVDVASGATQIIAQRSDGSLYKPLAWDRPGKLAAAAEIGPGGVDSAYLTFDLSRSPIGSTSTHDSDPGKMQASADARFGSSAGAYSGVVRWWPVASYGAAGTVGATTLSLPVWRPGTSQLGWVEDGELRLFDAARGTTAVALRGLAGNVTLLTFRVDGSAAVLATRTGPGVGGTTYRIVDVASGASADLRITVGNSSLPVRLR